MLRSAGRSLKRALQMHVVPFADALLPLQEKS
jgi:hypothetical protein